MQELGPKIRQEHNLELPYVILKALPPRFNTLLFTNVFFRCRWWALIKNPNGDHTFYFSSRQDGVNVARYMKRLEKLKVVEMIKVGEKNKKSNTYRWTRDDN